MRRHSSKCGTTKSHTTFLDIAVLYEKTSIENRTISVHRKAFESDVLREMEVTDDVNEELTFPPFWAIRPPYGIRLGSNFMNPFRADIEDLVDEGRKDKSQKLSTAQILEKLKLKYPEQLDISITCHINIHVTSYRGVLKDNGKEGNYEYYEDAEGNFSRKKKYRIPVRYVQHLDCTAHGNVNLWEACIRLLVLWALKLTEESLPADFPIEYRIISRENNLRSNIMRSTGRSSYYVVPE